MSAAGIVDTIEDLLAYVCSKFKMAMADYINIESIDDEQTMTMRDGTLLTVSRDRKKELLNQLSKLT